MQTIVALAIVALASAGPATQNKNNWVAEANAFTAQFAMGDTEAFDVVKPQAGLIASSSAVNQKTGSNLRFWKGMDMTTGHMAGKAKKVDEQNLKPAENALAKVAAALGGMAHDQQEFANGEGEATQKQ